MILLVGSPCSGKSTIGRLLSEATNTKLVTLDEFIRNSVKENNIMEGDILTDEFIDDVVNEFFTQMISDSTRQTVIYELPYHDYSQLFRDGCIPSQALIIGFYASYQTILARNRARKLVERIPLKYLERSHDSIQREIQNKRIHFFDTGEKTTDSIINEIINLIPKHD